MLYKNFKVTCSYSLMVSSFGKSGTFLFLPKDYEAIGSEFCDLLGAFMVKKYQVDPPNIAHWIRCHRKRQDRPTLGHHFPRSNR